VVSPDRGPRPRSGGGRIEENDGVRLGWLRPFRVKACVSVPGDQPPRPELSLARRSSSSANSARRRLISLLTRVSSALACCSLT
jgi:hypothetical protein